MGMEHLPYGKVVAAMYLKISISDFLTLFSARTHDKWFWTSQPNKVLLGGAVFALTLSTSEHPRRPCVRLPPSQLIREVGLRGIYGILHESAVSTLLHMTGSSPFPAPLPCVHAQQRPDRLSCSPFRAVLAEVWPDGKTDGIPADGLSNGGKDEALFVYVWLYCLFWWLVQVRSWPCRLLGEILCSHLVAVAIQREALSYGAMPLQRLGHPLVTPQDASKVGVYWLMHRYNVFNINASDLVNMRAAEHPDDAQHPLARMSVGMVESRLLESHAQEAIQRLSAVSPGLQRLSQRLSIARSSLRQGRGADPAQMARQVHQATCEALANLKGEDNPEVRQMLENIRRATANLERVARLGQVRRRDETRVVFSTGAFALCASLLLAASRAPSLSPPSFMAHAPPSCTAGALYPCFP